MNIKRPAHDQHRVRTSEVTISMQWRRRGQAHSATPKAAQEAISYPEPPPLSSPDLCAPSLGFNFHFPPDELHGNFTWLISMHL